MTDSPQEPPARRPPIPEGRAAAVIVLVAFAARLYLLLSTHRTAEDFYITLRYAENIARGQGFVYNAGQHVLGTTTPLYTLYLALAHWLGLNATLCGQLLNVVADSATCYALCRLARAVIGPSASGGMPGLVAAAIVAVWPPSLYWSISGMETGLVTLCGTAALAATAERRPYALAVWSALLVLLRIDGLLLAAVCFGWLAVWGHSTTEAPRHRGRVGRAFGLFIVLLAPWVVFATVYFGSPIPTSLIAKLHVYGWQSPGLLPNLRPFARDMTRNGLYWILLVGAIPSVFVAWRQTGLRPALVWIILYYGGMAFSKSFLFGWYYVPPAPIYILISIQGWVWLGSLVVHGRVGSRLCYAAVAIVLLAGIVLLPKQRALIAADQRQDEALLKSTGLLLAKMIAPGETLMLEPIGWIGYYSHARILDAVGLVSPDVIPYFRQGAVSPYLDILHDLRPEWALLRTGEYDQAARAAVPPDYRLPASYEIVLEIPNPAAPRNRPAFYLLRRRTTPGPGSQPLH